MDDENIVAIALLTQTDVDRLGSNLRQIYPIEESTCFDDLLEALDRIKSKEDEGSAA